MLEALPYTCPLHSQMRLQPIATIEPTFLECPECSRRYRRTGGILDVASELFPDDEELVQESQQWDRHADGYNEPRERDAIYLNCLQGVVEALDPQPGQLVLDAGCGTGMGVRRYITPEIRVVGMDLSQRSLEHLGTYGLTNLELVRGSITQIPFADNTFDRVVCANTIQHIRDEAVLQQAFRELARVTKPEAPIVISAHQFSRSKRKDGASKEGPSGSSSGAVRFIRRFTLPELRTALDEVLIVHRCFGLGYPLPYRWKLSRLSYWLERRLWFRTRWIESAHMLAVVCTKRIQTHSEPDTQSIPKRIR